MWWGLIGFVIALIIVMILLGVLMERGGTSAGDDHH
jgi:hypothetical protein